MIKILILFLCISFCNADIYYVRTDGVGGGSGPDAGDAFGTIQAGCDAMSAGDTCYVKVGQYNEDVDLDTNAGSSGNRIVIEGDEYGRISDWPAGDVIVDGGVTRNYAFDTNKNYLPKEKIERPYCPHISFTTNDMEKSVKDLQEKT